MLTFLIWCILFVVCWPLALLALVLYPFVWVMLLPFRLVGIAVHGALALARGAQQKQLRSSLPGCRYRS